MKSSLFLDVNGWLALSHQRHAHCATAKDWLHSVDEQIVFCRFTQMGLLRLLTNEQVMGRDALSQAAAWRAYHTWYQDERIEFHREPEQAEFNHLFQTFSTGPRRATKVWADAYLAAFAQAAGLTLVTFDQAFRAASIPVWVLSP